MLDSHERGGTVASVLPWLTTDKHQSVGITALLKEYVTNLCEHEQTWLKFPLQETLKRKSDSRKRRPTTSILIAKTSQSNAEETPNNAPLAPESSAVPRRYRSKSESAASLRATIEQMRDIPQLQQVEEEQKKPSSLLSFLRFFQKEEEAPKLDDSKEAAKAKEPREGEKEKEDTSIEQNNTQKSASAEETTTEEAEEEEWHMTKKQKQHAFMILKEVPQLNELRRQLVPKKMSEENFWQVYFFLVSNKLGHILEEDYDEEIKYDFRRYSVLIALGSTDWLRLFSARRPRKNPTDPSLKHISPYVQLFQGKPKVKLILAHSVGWYWTLF